MKKRNMVTKKPIMKTKTVIFLIVILIIAAILGIYKFKRDFQIEQENPPKLYFYGENGKKIELLPIEYSWEYKGETKTYKDEDFLNRDYSDMETVYLDSALGETGAYLQTEEKYKINSVYRNYYKFGGMNVGGGTVGFKENDNTKIYADTSSSNAGSFLIRYDVNYKKQGYVSYVQKVTVLNRNNIKTASNYTNINLEEQEKITNLVKELEFKQILKSVKVENKNLVIEYEYYPVEGILTSNNAILFACINDLENIVYTATNKKTFYTEKVENQYQIVYDENRENFIVNKVDFENSTNISLNDLKKYIEEV